MNIYLADIKASAFEDMENGFKQTVTCEICDDGLPITKSTQLSKPMCESTGDFDTDDLNREILAIISDGIVEAGNGQVTIEIREKPERDLRVYWYGR